ncbi:hypothetical protein SOV_39630 [Sporomusa ovata DSM 2662]|uniref:DUF8042 domain-containing protein n=1 Tax=Sporomusa ovata TaxID=2378 RepID=A0A0U1KTJ2_9FIRM|nr:hypothetical protein [Sporomusa ovata]EQB26350.1 hypothetical protein SOV_3c02240 [Sporomusa ovata DSM 2662]CQR70429.1 hypothetical protein SpAn4DRAFT_1398 [Sporomusa ovata]
MNLFSDPNQEVIYHIFELLPTIEEGLRHMQMQLEELRLEESAELFKNTAEAIGSIACSILPMLAGDNDQQLFQSITHIRQSITSTINAYEQNDLATIQSTLTHQLLPAYTRWQQDLEQRFRPSVLS